jgi:hypothetical protein
MFSEWARVVCGNVIFARETFFETEEAGGGAIAVGATVFGPTDIAVVFVDGSDVRPSTLGASDECLRSFAVGYGMTQTEAAAALNEGWAALKGPDGGLAAEEVRGRATHEFETVAIWIVK